MNRTSFPTEIILEVFSALASLEDVNSLSATSHRLKAIWTEYAEPIYRCVAPRSVKGEKFARALQLSISGNSAVTASDALSIMHRANFVESITNQFDEKYARNFRSMSPFTHSYTQKRTLTLLSGAFFGKEIYPETGQHPRVLTATERRRFIRTYYQLWALIRLDEHQWQEAISSLLLKQVYLLREMCFLALPIGEDQPGPRMLQEFPRFVMYNLREGRRGRLGLVLQNNINEYCKLKYSHWCDPYPWAVCKESYYEGYAGFHLLWDHAKIDNKMNCLSRLKQRRFMLSEEEIENERRHLWVETSDEEDGI